LLFIGFPWARIRTNRRCVFVVQAELAADILGITWLMDD
jgi:hypothetical protein